MLLLDVTHKMLEEVIWAKESAAKERIDTEKELETLWV